MLKQMKIFSPVGTMLAISKDRWLVMLDFIEPQRADLSWGRVAGRLGETVAPTEVDAGQDSVLDDTADQLADYFAGRRREFDLPLKPIGTDFELRTWNALLAIPFGQTWSYLQQATAMNCPRACRAVGGANGRNPLAVVIPCHRVIGASGKLTGYGGGIERKQWLLQHERLKE
jgi:O-6-methylguanine DNA methyltransferase